MWLMFVNTASYWHLWKTLYENFYYMSIIFKLEKQFVKEICDRFHLRFLPRRTHCIFYNILQDWGKQKVLLYLLLTVSYLTAWQKYISHETCYQWLCAATESILALMPHGGPQLVDDGWPEIERYHQWKSLTVELLHHLNAQMDKLNVQWQKIPMDGCVYVSPAQRWSDSRTPPVGPARKSPPAEGWRAWRYDGLWLSRTRRKRQPRGTSDPGTSRSEPPGPAARCTPNPQSDAAASTAAH